MIDDVIDALNAASNLDIVNIRRRAIPATVKANLEDMLPEGELHALQIELAWEHFQYGTLKNIERVITHATGFDYFDYTHLREYVYDDTYTLAVYFLI